MNKLPSIQRKKIRIGDISISYLVSPCAQPKYTVVFIHGFPFNKNMWIPQLESLPQDVQGIALDVRGHGRSTIGHGFFSVDVFARDLIGFIEKIGLRQIVLCGVSMGGYIALRTFELAPALLKGLVLVSTHAQADTDAAKIKRFDTIQSVLKHGRRTFAIGFVKNVFSDYSLNTKPDEVAFIRSSIRRNDVRSICATLLALAARTDTTASLKKIDFPVLVIKGTEDRLVSTEQIEQLKTYIPRVEFAQLDLCGHLPNLEDTKQFNYLIDQYLTTLS